MVSGLMTNSAALTPLKTPTLNTLLFQKNWSLLRLVLSAQLSPKQTLNQNKNKRFLRSLAKKYRSLDLTGQSFSPIQEELKK